MTKKETEETGITEDASTAPDENQLQTVSAVPEHKKFEGLSDFEECVSVLLSFYGIKADIKGILSELPRKDGPMELEDLGAVSKKLSLSSKMIECKADDVRTLAVPAIVQMSDDSYRIQFPVKTHYGKVYKPGEGITEETMQDVADSFSGVAFVITPLKTKAEAETSHMVRGHALDWFWQPIISFWPRYAEIIICSFFINIFVIALPLFTLNVYDRVVPNFATTTLVALAVGIVIAIGFDFFFKTVRSYILERVAARVGSKYDFDLMDRMMHIKPQMMRLSVGERVNIFRELQGIRDFYATRLAPTVIDLPFLLLFLFVIYLISPVLAIVPIIGALVIIAFNLIAQIPNNRANEQYFASMQNKSSLLVETLSGTQSFKMFNAMGNRLFHWDIATTKVAEASRRNQMIRATIQNVSMMIMSTVHVFVVFVGVY